MFTTSLNQFTYEWVLKKRLLKRLFGVLILEIQNASAYVKEVGDSYKAWQHFKDITAKHFETIKSIFSQVFKDKQPL